MNSRAMWLSVVAVILSFIGGFILANALNRRELNELKAENSRFKTEQTEPADATLSDGEIAARVAEADQNTGNFDAQKNLGIALYRYAGAKQDAKLLPDAARLLERAFSLQATDYQTIVTLGNLYSDLGQIKKDNANLEKSRDFYRKALALKADDSDVQTDLAATYFYSNPSDSEKAIDELQKALRMNAKNEKTLENLIVVQLAAGKKSDAEETLKRLKSVNQKNESLPELEARLAQTN